MKKVFVLFLMAGALSFASCGGEKKAEEATETTAPAENNPVQPIEESADSTHATDSTEAAAPAPAH